MKRHLRWVIGIMLILWYGVLLQAESVDAEVSPNAGRLIITEVSFRNSTNDWLELFVVDGSVDFTGYQIWDGASSQKTILSSLASNLATGDYIVVHEELGSDETADKGLNGYWDLYNFGDIIATDRVLQVKDSSGKRVDALIYSDASTSFSSSVIEANGASVDGMWDSYDFNTGDSGAWTDSDLISSTESLARYLDSGSPIYRDTNSKTDWYEEGSPTLGTDNNQQPTAIRLGAFRARAMAHSQGEWLVALGLSGGVLVGVVMRRWLKVVTGNCQPTGFGSPRPLSMNGQRMGRGDSFYIR
jgi:hypothetical protein